MFPRVIQFLSGRTLARPAAGSISALLQCTILATIAVSMFAGVNISVGESVQGNVVAQVEMGGGEVWANALDTTTGSVVKNTPTQSDKDDIWKTITSLVNGFIAVFFFIATPFLMLVGWLMTPDWVFGEIFGFRPVLHSLWVLVSNVVYVIFAFLLVVMAFMNIFAGEKNTWAIKAKLPKLIVGVISVPFTWFFVSAVVSISSVLTASAIQLAGDLVPNGSEFKVPRYECTLDFTKSPVAKDASGNSISADTCKEVGSPKPLSEYLKSGEAYGLVSYYAYGIFQIQDLKKITKTNSETIKTVLDMGVGLLLGLIIFVIFFLIIIALVVALLTRAIYFWAIAVCSPLLSLAYFFDGKIGFGESWLSPRKIIDLAMVPVYVALALALGLVFISAVGSSPDISLKSDYVQDVKTENGLQTFTILDNKISIKGDPLGATAVIKDAKTLGGGVLGGFLVKILALCILWFAVMAAFKSSKITGDMVEPIANIGKEIGGLLKKIPQYAPIIPTPHGMVSTNTLSNISNRVVGDIQSAQNKKGQDKGDSVSQWLGTAPAPTIRAIQSSASTVVTSNIVAAETFSTMMRGADAKNLDEFTSGTKRREREEIAKVLEGKNFVGSGIPAAALKEIADGLKSTAPDEVIRALKKLGQNLNGTTVTSLSIGRVEQDAWIKSLKTSAAGTPAATNGAAPAAPKLSIAIKAGDTRNLDIQVIAGEMSNFAAKTADFAAIRTDLVGKTLAEQQVLTTTVKAQLNAAGIYSDSEVKKILTALGLPTV